MPFIPSYIILSVCQFEISARFRLNTALLVGILRVFCGCLKQSFPEGIIKPYEGTSLTIKSATSFRISSHLATRMKD